MTATLTATRAAKTRNPYDVPDWYGWSTYVVPSYQLRAFVLDHVQQWQQFAPIAKHEAMGEGIVDEDGWRSVLAQDVGQILGKSRETILRRLYDYLEGRANICRAEFADAVCLSLGLHLENDAHLTVLPGSKRLAIEMVSDRAAFEKVQLPPDTLLDYAHRVLWLSSQIVANPDRTAELVGKSPLNCLGSY